jgi:hypothetical protein
MTHPTAASLPELAAKLETHVNELRRTGDHGTILATTKAAGDEIECRAKCSRADNESALQLTQALRRGLPLRAHASRNRVTNVISAGADHWSLQDPGASGGLRSVYFAISQRRAG